MDNDELPVNQNGELIMMALRDIEKPVSINKLVKFVADAAGKPESSIRQSVEETIRGGVRYGYIFEANPVDAECIETASDVESRASKSQRAQKRTHEAMDDEVVSNNDATDLNNVACSDDENCICTCKIKKAKQTSAKLPKRKYVKKRTYDDEELHDEYKAKKIKKTPQPRSTAAKRKRAAVAATVDDEEPKAKKQKPSAVICKKRAAKKPSNRPQMTPVDEDEIPDNSDDEDDVNAVKERDVQKKSGRPRALQSLEEMPDNNDGDGEKHSGKQSHKESVVSKKCRGRFKDVQVDEESPDKNDDLKSTITFISKKRRDSTKQSGRFKETQLDKDLSDDNDDLSDIVSIIRVTKKKRRDAPNQIDHCKNLEVDEELLDDDDDEDEIVSTITTVTKKKRRDATKQSVRLKNVPVDDEFSDDNNGESDLESTIRTSARIKHQDAKRKSGLFDKDLPDDNKSDGEIKSIKTTYPIKKHHNAEKKSGRNFETIPKGSDGENTTTTTKIIFKKRRDALKKPMRANAGCFKEEVSDNSASETEMKNKNIRAAKKYAGFNFGEMSDVIEVERHRELDDELSEDENDGEDFYETLNYSKVKKPFRWTDVSFVEAVRKQTNPDNTKVENQPKNSAQKTITASKRNDDNEQGETLRSPDSNKDESEQNSKLKTSKSTKPIVKNVQPVDKDGEDKKC